jgi:hypothetical protein
VRFLRRGPNGAAEVTGEVGKTLQPALERRVRAEDPLRVDVKSPGGRLSRDDEERAQTRDRAQILARDERHVAGEPLEGALELLGRACEERGAAIRDVLPVTGDRHDERGNDRVEDPHEEENEEAVEEREDDDRLRRPLDTPGQVCEPGEDSRAQHRGGSHERHDEGVAVRDMSELVREDGLELLRAQSGAQTAGDNHDRVAGRASRRERVRNVGVGDRDPGRRHVGHRRQSLDERVELGLLVLADDAGARACKRDPLGNRR